MDTAQTTMSRLAFIKYLYTASITQSKAPTPLCYASLLTMHDAVELFLQLASEQLNAGAKKSTKFMDYWTIINGMLGKDRLSQEASMDRLNKARVALKHYGTYPSQFDLEAFRGNVVSFFSENTPIVFEMDIADVSLIEFVHPDSARQRLRDAESDYKNEDLDSALGKIAIAFIEIIGDYENRKADKFNRSPFDFADHWGLPDSTDIEMEMMGDIGYHQRVSLGKLGDFIDQVRESITTLQSTMKILTLGLDYRKYANFIRIVPEARQSAAGKWITRPRYLKENDKSTQDDVQYCLDFVIECSLVLRQFDYTLQGRKPMVDLLPEQ